MSFVLGALMRSAVCAACGEENNGYGVETGFRYTPFEDLCAGGTTFTILDGNGASNRLAPLDGQASHGMLVLALASYHRARMTVTRRPPDH